MKTSFEERILAALHNRLILHFLLISAVVLLSFWEVKDIYMEGSRWFPVAKTSVITLLVIYLNIYILASQILVKRRWFWVYLLTVLYIALLVYFIEIRLNDVVYLRYTTRIMELFGKIEINPLLQVFTSVFSLVVLMLSSSAVVLFSKWTKHDSNVNNLERNALQVELEQLKKQLNPQFLLRLLDCANSMLLKGNSKEASEILLKLSNILRYQLYDSSREFVLFSSDIRFITEILSLERKCRDNFLFTVESDGNLQNCLIPPLLFLPFIEHIISTNMEVKFIDLFFQLDNDTLLFECQTPKTSTITNTESGEFDIICRRLELLYENAYSLKIRNTDGMQIINLSIFLQRSGSKSIAS